MESAREISLPPARGPWTDALYELLAGGSGRGSQGLPAGSDGVGGSEGLGGAEVLGDDDLQLALYLCYELHYSAIEGVDPELEWSPDVLAFRAVLEQHFARGVGELVGPLEPVASVGGELKRMVAEDDGPALSRYVEERAEREQVLEFVVHRSAYQLKEADPHSWAIPRLFGAAKAALLEVQFDEYGAGRAERIHSNLFAQTMTGLGLDPSYGAYLASLPGITLATVNLMSWFGLHRRLRGSLVGHLAVFEMTSSVPNRRYGQGLRRLGYGPEVTEFYDEHVEADAVHENIATWDLADRLARLEPELAQDIVFGGRALLALEARWAAHLLDAWAEDRSSLLAPMPVATPAA